MLSWNSLLFMPTRVLWISSGHWCAARIQLATAGQDQVYRTSDLLQMPIRYENFGLTIPIHIREHVYAYSPKPYLILCCLTSEAARPAERCVAVAAGLDLADALAE